MSLLKSWWWDEKFFFILPTESIGPWTPYISHESSVENVTNFYGLNTTLRLISSCFFLIMFHHPKLFENFMVYLWINDTFFEKKIPLHLDISLQNSHSKFLKRHNSAKNCLKIRKKTWGSSDPLKFIQKRRNFYLHLAKNKKLRENTFCLLPRKILATKV